MSQTRSESPQPWRTLRSEVVVEDRWIRLRADECVDEHDRRIAPFYVLEYGDWVSVLAVDTAGQAILVEEYRHGAGVVAQGTIGGAIELGEKPRRAAERELREETGYEAREVIPLGATWANFGNHSNRVHHFLARDCVRVSEQSPDESESIAVRMLPMADVSAQLEQSYHLLTWYKAQAWLAGGAPGSL